METLIHLCDVSKISATDRAEVKRLWDAVNNAKLGKAHRAAIAAHKAKLAQLGISI